MLLLARHLQIRLRLFNHGPCRLHLGFIPARIDLKQLLSFPDQVPFLERHLSQPALDVGSDFHRGNRLSPRREFRRDRHFVALGGLDHDSRRRYRANSTLRPRPRASSVKENTERRECELHGAISPVHSRFREFSSIVQPANGVLSGRFFSKIFFLKCLRLLHEVLYSVECRL